MVSPASVNAPTQTLAWISISDWSGMCRSGCSKIPAMNALPLIVMQHLLCLWLSVVFLGSSVSISGLLY